MKKNVSDGFQQAYTDYKEALMRQCLFRVYNKSLAEEIVQETYMKVWVYLKQGNEIDNIRAFLYRVANNLIIDYTRKKKEESLEALMEKSPGYEPYYNGGKKMEKEIMYNGVLEKMEKLPSDYKNILRLRFVSDLYPKDIAEMFKTKANNVSVKINRAVKALRLQMNT